MIAEKKITSVLNKFVRITRPVTIRKRLGNDRCCRAFVSLCGADKTLQFVSSKVQE